MAIGAIWGEIWDEAIWDTDIWSQDAPVGNTAPDTPTITADPPSFASCQLFGSPFSDDNSGDAHAASQWQVTTAADTGYAAVVVDSGETSENLLTYSAGGLDAETEYICRVRYKDDSGDVATEWSEWSADDSFTTTATPSTAPGPNPTTPEDVVGAGWRGPFAFGIALLLAGQVANGILSEGLGARGIEGHVDHDARAGLGRTTLTADQAPSEQDGQHYGKVSHGSTVIGSGPERKG